MQHLILMIEQRRYQEEFKMHRIIMGVTGEDCTAISNKYCNVYCHYGTGAMTKTVCYLVAN